MASSAETTSSRTSGSGRSGPRASLACMNCRQRKIKCRMPDSNAPSCVSCRSLNLPCVVNKDGDRRKAGSRQHVAALQERLDYLESYIAKGQQNVPSNLSENSDSSAGTMFAPNTVGSHISPPPSSATRPSFDSSSGIIGDPGLPHGGFIGAQNSQTSPSPLSMMKHDPNVKFERNTSPRTIIPESSLRTDLGRLTPSTDKDPSRLELDEADGQPRIYGPTSQPYLQRHSVPTEDEDFFGQDDENLSADSTPLRAVLFQTYWKIQPHSVVLVDEQLFLHGREMGGRSEYYSAFMEDIVLASATRMSTSEGVRALGAKFASRAKEHISDELEKPNIATLQGFLLLSDFEATRGRDRLGYLYCGIACRLVFDLGLHEDCDDLVAKGKLSRAEAMWRHTLFMGAFVFDKLWSLYLGRPGTIPISTFETAHNRALASGWYGPTTLDPWCGLCCEISEVTDILNNGGPLDRDAKERLIDLDARIQRRSEALPPSLRINKDRIAELPANSYAMHIQFHGIRVILHRLLYKTSAQEIETPSDADHQQFSLQRSLQIMYENAIQVAQLVSVYQQIFGIEQVITIMLDNSYLAASVLISHVFRMQNTDPSMPVERELQKLRALADLLFKAQKHYPVTVRIRFTLANLVNNTPLAGMFGNFAQMIPGMPKNAAVTLQPNSNPQTATETTSEILLPDMGGLRNDMALFEDWDGTDRIFQEMDLQNMMSWSLAPNPTRVETTPF